MAKEREFEVPKVQSDHKDHWLNFEATRENSNLYKITLTGDEVEWKARPGVNLDDSGEPQPFMKEAECVVTLRARSQDEAVYWALARESEAGYHTVKEVEYVEEDPEA